MPPELRLTSLSVLAALAAPLVASTASRAQDTRGQEQPARQGEARPGEARPAGPAANQQGAAGAAAPVSVAVSPATVGQVAVEVVSNGTAEAPLVISVRARVDGQVERVHVQEGDSVRAGQVLFTLDARASQALLQQQQATLERDRAQLARARSDAQRYASLQSGAYASAQRSEQAQADSNALAATVRAGEALLEQTQLAIDFATIRAEAAGRLGALPVKAGNFVRASEGVVLATITQTDPILVTFSVPERWLGELRAAQTRGEVPKVRTRAPEDTGPPAEGELVFVDSAVDPTTGTIRLKARFANAVATGPRSAGTAPQPQGAPAQGSGVQGAAAQVASAQAQGAAGQGSGTQPRFWPGQYLEVVLLPRVDQRALSVPSAALRNGPQGAFLFAVRPDGTVRRVTAKVVRFASGRAVVEAELADGERVVTEGQQRLQDGARVAVRDPEGGARRTADAAGATSGVAAR